MQYLNIIQDIISQYMERSIKYIDDLKTAIRYAYTDHPEALIHMMFTSILVLLLWTFIQHISLMRKLDGVDRRNILSLLTIQKYCVTNARAINELTETVNKNDKTTNAKLTAVHTRMKDVYTGIFKHLDLNRIRRAPKTATLEQCIKAEKDCEERNAILREVINEMLATE